MNKYKLVDYRPNGWFITYKSGRTNPDSYQPLYTIHYADDKYLAYDNTKSFIIEDKSELEKYVDECLKYLKEKYPNGKD